MALGFRSRCAAMSSKPCSTPEGYCRSGRVTNTRSESTISTPHRSKCSCSARSSAMRTDASVNTMRHSKGSSGHTTPCGTAKVRQDTQHLALERAPHHAPVFYQKSNSSSP
eukprot:9149868-Pyramimonas_sp.AAC.1